MDVPGNSSLLAEEKNNDYSVIKQPSFSWYYTLESESSVPTDEDVESIYTMQDHETEFAYDTADTTTHSYWSSNESNIYTEFDMDSHAENKNENNSICSSSSEPQNILAVELTNCTEEEGLADDSEDSTCSNNNDIKRVQFWNCIQCEKQNSNVLFRYCSSCYQIRKTSRSSNRPKKKRKFREDRGTLSTISAEGNTGAFVFNDQQNGNLENLCLMCTDNPKNGVFVHGKITHICCCYQCALKIWSNNGNRCPICNRKVGKILKAFYA